MIGSYDDKKEKILIASMKVFAKYGYHKTTLDDIANQLNIKKNSLYYYFPNKESIFNEIIIAQRQNLIETLQKEIKKHGSTEHKLKSFLKKLIYYSSERASLYSISFEVFKEIGEIIEASYKEFKTSVRLLFESILLEGVKNGELKEHNSEGFADNILLYASLLQLKEFQSSNVHSFEEIDFKGIEKRIHFVLDSILSGLLVKPENNNNQSNI